MLVHLLVLGGMIRYNVIKCFQSVDFILVLQFIRWNSFDGSIGGRYTSVIETRKKIVIGSKKRGKKKCEKRFFSEEIKF